MDWKKEIRSLKKAQDDYNLRRWWVKVDGEYKVAFVEKKNDIQKYPNEAWRRLYSQWR